MELAPSRRSTTFSHVQRSCLKTEQGRICRLHLFNRFCHLSHGFASSGRRAPAVPVPFRPPLPGSGTRSGDTWPSGPGSPAGLCASPWPGSPGSLGTHPSDPPTPPRIPACSTAVSGVSLRARSSPQRPHSGCPQAGKRHLEPTRAPISCRSAGRRGLARPAAPHGSPGMPGQPHAPRLRPGFEHILSRLYNR